MQRWTATWRAGAGTGTLEQLTTEAPPAGPRGAASSRRSATADETLRRDRPRPDLWETHAGWWQEGFTEGADPEYEEQILPLAAEHLAGARRVLDVGCGEGQVARLGSRPAAPTVGRRRPDVGPGRGRPSRGGGARLRPGRRRRPAVRRRRLRLRGRLPRVRAHRRRRRGHRRGRPGCSSRAAGSCSSSTTRCCRRPNSGWIDDQILDPPEQYWRIGPYLRRGRDASRRWRRTCSSRSSTGRCPATSTPSADQRPAPSPRMEEPAPPPGLPRPGRRVRRRGRRSRGCSSCAPRSWQRR